MNNVHQSSFHLTGPPQRFKRRNPFLLYVYLYPTIRLRIYTHACTSCRCDVEAKHLYALTEQNTLRKLVYTYKAAHTNSQPWEPCRANFEERAARTSALISLASAFPSRVARSIHFYYMNAHAPTMYTHVYIYTACVQQYIRVFAATRVACYTVTVYVCATRVVSTAKPSRFCSLRVWGVCMHTTFILFFALVNENHRATRAFQRAWCANLFG